MYGRICANYQSEKDDPYQVHITIGGNRISYPSNCGMPMANMLTTNVLLDSVISTKGAIFMTIDIKDLYLNTPMDHPKYMQHKVAEIPDNFIALYNLNQLTTTKGYIYVLIQEGMCGLPQAGIIAQQLLKKRVATKGYQQSTLTPGFWKHDCHPFSFTLCVNDFRVKYVGIKHADHLLQILNEH